MRHQLAACAALYPALPQPLLTLLAALSGSAYSARSATTLLAGLQGISSFHAATVCRVGSACMQARHTMSVIGAAARRHRGRRRGARAQPPAAARPAERPTDVGRAGTTGCRRCRCMEQHASPNLSYQGTRGEVLTIPAGATAAFGPTTPAHGGFMLVQWAAGGPQGVAQWVLLSRACAALGQLQQGCEHPALLLPELQHTAACVAAMGRADPTTLQELLQEGMRVPVVNTSRHMDLIDVLAGGLNVAAQVQPPPLDALAALLELATACAALVPGRAVAAVLGSPLLGVTNASLFGRPLEATGVAGWAAVLRVEQQRGSYPVTMAALELLCRAATSSALPDVAVCGKSFARRSISVHSFTGVCPFCGDAHPGAALLAARQAQEHALDPADGLPAPGAAGPGCTRGAGRRAAALAGADAAV